MIKMAVAKARLKSRHFTMMSIAGVTGGSLFVGTGNVIHNAGPAVLLALMVACVLAALNIWSFREVKGISNLTAHGFVPNGIKPVVGAMPGVMFAFLGAEVATIATSESKNSAQKLSKPPSRWFGGSVCSMWVDFLDRLFGALD